MRNRIITGFLSLLVMGLLFAASSSTSFGEETLSTSTDPIIGDADCSGKINVIDALKAIRYNAGLEEYSDCISLADTDCDVDVDMRDALTIMWFAVGKPLPSEGKCVVGQPVPDLEEDTTVVSEEALFNDEGVQVGSLVHASGDVDDDDETRMTAAASYYRHCYSEVYAKNGFGMKVFSLKHHQSFYYDGSRVTYMFQPYRSGSTAPGWSMHDAWTTDDHNRGWYGYSYSGATFKYLNVPWFGSLQSYTVTAGIYVYGSGYCYPWGYW